jgi:rare lipoprotein A
MAAQMTFSFWSQLGPIPARNCGAMTAAHRTLPFGTRVRVCHSGCVIVRINDRGPFVRSRHIDLSPAAARAIGLHQTGQVTLTRM